ncbi:phosphopantetheine-binding protein [Embleya sp. NBC_00896]|uniref:phosphopantetheine-binding protein n=1 Tax=Embleya sp. NBC_00896 TaxID=2975961 RepID=UPI002F9171A0|nr:phosphopantetheine-binding protein [Embleya sp. NBC_00896]
MSPGGDLRERVAELIASVSDGEVSAREVLDTDGSLTAAGVSSLTFLRVIDALEGEFGVYFDLDGDLAFVEDLDALVDRLTRHGVAAGDG